MSLSQVRTHRNPAAQTLFAYILVRKQYQTKAKLPVAKAKLPDAK
jgi:hypothetical protein